MSKFFKIFIVLVIFKSSIVFCQSQFEAKITYCKGNIKICSKGKCQKAKISSTLKSGDMVKADKGARCEILFFEGSIIRLDQYAEFKINVAKHLKQKNENSISLSLENGNLWSKVKKALTSSTNCQIDTPTTLVGIRSTVYRVAVDKDKATLVRVYKGKVEVKTWISAYKEMIKIKPYKEKLKEKKKEEIEGPYEVEGPSEVTLEEWIRIVGEMQEVKISPDKIPEKVGKFDPTEDEMDEWVRWNKERDKMYEE